MLHPETGYAAPGEGMLHTGRGMLQPAPYEGFRTEAPEGEG
jgi:hypothetical protein